MYCIKCGAEIMDEAVICPKCGCYTHNINKPKPQEETPTVNVTGIKKTAKIFMIIGCVIMGFWPISLAWTLPMTLNYCNKLRTGEQVTTGFKVCTLLFVSLIAGILMLCSDD